MYRKCYTLNFIGGVFRIVDDELLVYLFEIGSRGNIYKKINVQKSIII